MKSAGQRKTNIAYNIASMWNLFFKRDTNELIYKTDRDSNIEEKFMIIKREKGEEAQFRKLELTYTHYHI